MQMQNPAYGQTSSVPQLGAVNYNGASTSGGPSVLGTGMYSSPGVNVNLGAFNNPVGQQAGQQLSGELTNFLPNTTNPAATGDMTGYNAGMAGQLGLAQQYQALANGQGPSQASVAAQQAGAQNLAASESMLGSARGAGNPAAAQSAAADAASTGQNQIAQNMVAGRTAEELGALGGAAGAYNNITGQGLQQQSLGQNLNISNQANNLAANQAYMNQLGQINAQQQQGQIEGQQTSVGAQESANNLGQAAYQNSANANAAIGKQVFGGASQIGMALL